MVVVAIFGFRENVIFYQFVEKYVTDASFPSNMVTLTVKMGKYGSSWRKA